MGARLMAVAVAADDFDLGQSLDALPVTYLECRDLGHYWRSFTAAYNRKDRQYSQSLRCQRCDTVRTRVFGPSGQLLGNWYDYPDGYLMPGAGHLSSLDRDGIRLRSITHAIETAQAEAASVTPIKRGKRK